MPGVNPFNFGMRNNCGLVFGRRALLWGWPYPTHDVLMATAHGSDFRHYIGDPWPQPDISYVEVAALLAEEAAAAGHELGLMEDGLAEEDARLLK